MRGDALAEKNREFTLRQDERKDAQNGRNMNLLNSEMAGKIVHTGIPEIDDEINNNIISTYNKSMADLNNGVRDYNAVRANINTVVPSLMSRASVISSEYANGKNGIAAANKDVALNQVGVENNLRQSLIENYLGKDGKLLPNAMPANWNKNLGDVNFLAKHIDGTKQFDNALNGTMEDVNLTTGNDHAQTKWDGKKSKLFHEDNFSNAPRSGVFTNIKTQPTVSVKKMIVHPDYIPNYTGDYAVLPKETMNDLMAMNPLLVKTTLTNLAQRKWGISGVRLMKNQKN